MLADSLHLTPEYLTKSQPSTSRRRTRRPFGHRSEEICAFSTMSFDKTAARPLHLVQVLAVPPDDITRRLKKPEFYLSTTITIRVEMTPLITKSRSDYHHTSILTHSNSTTTDDPTENVSVIENDHVSPLEKEPVSCSRRIESHERERNWKGGDAVLSCPVTVLIIEPLLRSKKSSYGLQTESCYKSCCFII